MATKTIAQTETDKTASAQITGTLERIGLGSLGKWAWNQYKAGKSIDQIYLDMVDRPEYKARFPAMATLSQQGHAISEQAYVQLEEQYMEVLRVLPKGFYDSPSDFTKYITGHVAPTELKARVDMASQAALSAPTETRTALRDLYGLSDGDLTAYWLDPTRALPLIQQQFQAAQTSGTAARSGYGALTRAEAERAATFGLTEDATNKAFDQLQRERELFSTLPGEGGTDITRAQQLDAALGGKTEDQLAIEQRAAQRAAQFGDKSRDFASTAKGIVGLGENPT